MPKTLPLILFILAGCTVVDKVEPVRKAPSMDSGRKICILANPTTRDSFQDSLVSALQYKDYKVTVVDADQAANCPVYITYMGKWTSDFNTYLTYADIKVFDQGMQIGRAKYDTAKASMVPLTRFVDADEKVRQMVDELF